MFLRWDIVIVLAEVNDEIHQKQNKKRKENPCFALWYSNSLQEYFSL